MNRLPNGRADATLIAFVSICHLSRQTATTATPLPAPVTISALPSPSRSPAPTYTPPFRVNAVANVVSTVP